MFGASIRIRIGAHVALLRHWGATDGASPRDSARPGFREALVIMVTTLLLVPVVGTAAGETGPPRAVLEQVVNVSDPLDAWLGGGQGTEGDLELARQTALPGVVVESGSPGQLVYRVPAAGGETAREALADSLSAYETARLELWGDLNRRLRFIPGLIEYLDLRISEAMGLPGSPVNATSPGGEPGSAGRGVQDDIAHWMAVRDELTRLRRSVVEPIWADAPVQLRLDEIDRVLDDRFWAAMTAGHA